MQIDRTTATLGARVSGLDLRSDVEEFASALRDALYEHKVLFIASEELSEEQQQKVAAIFGSPRPHPAALFLKGEHTAAEVYHDADRPPSLETGFHNDYSFSDEIPAVGVLQALELPSRGGDTIWADMHAAYDTLSPSFRDYLATLRGLHTQGAVIRIMRQRHGDEIADELSRRFDGRLHPLVVTHPVTGKRALFVNSYVSKIDGLTEKESSGILALLREHIGSPRFHCRYHWKLHDVVIWDELATSHQGPSDFFPERRILRRITAGLVRPGSGTTENLAA